MQTEAVQVGLAVQHSAVEHVERAQGEESNTVFAVKPPTHTVAALAAQLGLLVQHSSVEHTGKVHRPVGNGEIALKPVVHTPSVHLS